LPSERIARASVSLLLALLFACSGLPSASTFHVGDSPSEVLEEHGFPQRTQTFTKRDDAIWDPIEEFWSQVPVGNSVEIWAYPLHPAVLYRAPTQPSDLTVAVSITQGLYYNWGKDTLQFASLFNDRWRPVPRR
jgi:hypothetical protein